MAIYEAYPDPFPQRLDGWQNAYTGLGTSRDRSTSTSYYLDTRLTDFELDALFYGNDIAAKIVEFLPHEMFRRGYELRLQDTQSDIPDQLMARARELDLDAKLLDASVWGRLFGGCLVIFGVNDGQQVFSPLNEEGIRGLSYIHVIDKRYAQALTYYSDPLDPKYGMPETYQVGDPMFGSYHLVHETRCLRFEGVRTDSRRRRENAGWGLSVLQRCYEAIRDFGTAFQASGFMLSDASQGVFKMKGLMDAISAGNKELVLDRMQLVDMSRGVARSILLDADGNEDFQKIATQFGGVSDLLDRYMYRLASAADMPVAILMGRAPAGMNATGESDFRAFYATVEAAQENLLAPVLQRAYSIIAASMGIQLDGLDFVFRPLWSPTDKEQADLELTVANKDKVYADLGVLHPSEIALSRYGGGKWSSATEIDVESRERELEEDIKASMEPKEEPPMPPEEPANEEKQEGDQPQDTAEANPEGDLTEPTD